MSHTLPFQDGITDLDQTTLNQLEVKAQKTVANGYPSLDASGKVPIEQLPAIGGGGAVTGEFTFNTSTTEPPGSGQMRVNNSDQTLATKAWISYTTAPGSDMTNVLKLIKSGATLYVQDKDDATKWQNYIITADAVDKGSYAEFTVRFDRGGSPLTAQRVLVAINRAGSAGLPADTVIAAAIRIIANKLAAGDAQNSWRVMGDGSMVWGFGGSSPPDVNLYRGGVDTLRTDDSLFALAFKSLPPSTGYPAFYAQVVGEANERYMVQVDGKTTWGAGGASPTDTNLYRSAPDTLKTDDNFIALGAIDGDMLQYRGDWSAGSYQDGDIVVQGNIAYMCVKPTSAAPTAWPGSAFATPPTPVTAYGTTLPASPADGQEAILVDSLTNPSYQWRFRYNASSTSAYKWEFIGGPDAYARNDNDETTATVGSWVDLATIGPQIVVPRAGEYLAHATSDGYCSVAGVSSLAIALGLSGSVVATSFMTVPTSGVSNVMAIAAYRFTCAASDAVRMRYYNATASNTAHWQRRALTVQPVRVS